MTRAGHQKFFATGDPSDNMMTNLAICRPGRGETWLSRHKAVAAFLKLAGEDFRFFKFLASQFVEFGDQGPHVLLYFLNYPKSKHG